MPFCPLIDTHQVAATTGVSEVILRRSTRPAEFRSVFYSQSPQATYSNSTPLTSQPSTALYTRRKRYTCKNSFSIDSKFRARVSGNTVATSTNCSAIIAEKK